MPNIANEQRRLAAIMFTEMVGYSALTQRNEALALELLEEHRRILRELFPKFRGREVETTGDGFLVEFASALEASKCAIEIQRSISTRNLNVPLERQIQIRIGIHVGDVVHRGGHVLDPVRASEDLAMGMSKPISCFSGASTIWPTIPKTGSTTRSPVSKSLCASNPITCQPVSVWRRRTICWPFSDTCPASRPIP